MFNLHYNKDYYLFDRAKSLIEAAEKLEQYMQGGEHTGYAIVKDKNPTDEKVYVIYIRDKK